MIKQTVFPAKPGAFAPASFLSLADAMAYAFQQGRGVKMCSPGSFETHGPHFMGVDDDGLATYQLGFEL